MAYVCYDLRLFVFSAYEVISLQCGSMFCRDARKEEDEYDNGPLSVLKQSVKSNCQVSL